MEDHETITDVLTDLGTLAVENTGHLILDNPNLYIPVLAAWGAGFLCTLCLNEKNERRKAVREVWVYKINGGVAFILYLVFNYLEGFASIPQATLAATIAVLMPAVYFNYSKLRKK